MSDPRVPELRFDGFDGEWIAAKLGNIVDVVGGGTPSTTVPAFWAGEIDWYTPTEIGDHPVATRSRLTISELGLSKSAAKLLPGGRTVLFTSRASIGFAAILDHDATTNQGFQSFVVGPKADVRFIHSLTPIIKEYALQRATGSTFLEVSSRELREMPTYIPSLAEQEAIGALFSNLDSLLVQHRNKHEKLQQAKTALMQKMFSQGDADEPELRLEGFSGPWRRERLAKLGQFSKGQGYSKADLKAEGVPLFLYGRIYTNFEIAVVDVNTFADPRRGAVVSKGNEVLVPSSGETPEDIATAVALLQPGVHLGGDLNIISPTPNIDSVFLALRIGSGDVKASLAQRAQGKSVVHIRNSDLQVLEFGVPNLAEQQAIGAVFSHLDDLIAAEQKYIDKLEQAKSGLQQKMFV